jgi:hypothetical protein
MMLFMGNCGLPFGPRNWVVNQEPIGLNLCQFPLELSLRHARPRYGVRLIAGSGSRMMTTLPRNGRQSSVTTPCGQPAAGETSKETVLQIGDGRLIGDVCLSKRRCKRWGAS